MGTDLILASVFLVAATFMLPAYGALESEPTTPDSDSFSECLGDPIRGLVYRFQRPAKGLNHVKIGCYAKFGNGSTQFKNPPDRLKVLQYFVTDVTGTTMLRSRSDYANVVISSHSHNQVPIKEHQLNTSNSRRIKFDRACFPINCYTCADDWHQTCHSPDSENPTFRAYEVDTSLYCDRRGDNDLVPFLHGKRPFHVDRMLEFRNVSEIAKPFLLLDYEAVSQGVHFGCEIYKPLHSDTAFRKFYYGSFKQVNVSSIISLRLDEFKSLRLPPQDVSFQDFCFPLECYTANENAPCGNILGKPYKETSNYFSLNRETRLMSNAPYCM